MINKKTEIHNKVIQNNILEFIPISIFVSAPFFLLIVAIISNSFDFIPSVYAGENDVFVCYINISNHIARIVAAALYIILIYKKIGLKKSNTKKESKKRSILYLPFILFTLFAFSIILSTIIRGAGIYDLSGHPRMHENIWSYITYPLAYFFCGMMLVNKKYRNLILYILVMSSMPIAVITIFHVQLVNLPYFANIDIGAVFFNSNHYGYYLTVVIIIASLMAVYETNKKLRNYSVISAILNMITLIINNTFGAYLAVLIIFILFVIYCIIFEKKNIKKAFLVLGIFILITILMSFKNNTVVSNMLELSKGVKEISENPNASGTIGTGRLGIWRSTLRHLKESLWLGFGIEGLYHKYDIPTPHNEFLQYTAFFGIPASILYFLSCSTTLLIVLINLKNLDKETKISFFAALGYLASSMVGVAVFYTTPYVYILIGMSYAEVFNFSGEFPTTKTSGF